MVASLLLGLSMLAAAGGCGGAKQSAKPAQRTQSKSAKPANGTPASLVPNSIAFWDARHGLVGMGSNGQTHAAGAILATSNGGKTFRVALRTRVPVVWVTAVAGTSRAWAQLRSSRILLSTNRGRTWRMTRRQPEKPLRPSVAIIGEQLACPDLRGPCPVPNDFSGALAVTENGHLLATRNGGQTWKRLKGPCPRTVRQGISVTTIVSVSVTTRREWAVCTSQGGAGNEAKAIYRSSNGGKTWRLLVNVPITGRSSHGLASYGYPAGTSFSSEGSGLLWESRGFLYLTQDGGSNWRKLGVAATDVDSQQSAAMVSKTQGFVLLWRTRVGFRLFATIDGGRNWTVVHRWHAAR